MERENKTITIYKACFLVWLAKYQTTMTPTTISKIEQAILHISRIWESHRGHQVEEHQKI